MAESEFSWRKVASFLGAVALVVIAFIVISFGFHLVCDNGDWLYGPACIASGAVCAVNAAMIYASYQKRKK